MTSQSTARLGSLRKLRVRLTLWYAATFFVILAFLGGGLFLAIRNEYGEELDHSLRYATRGLERAAATRVLEAGAPGRVVDAVDELHIPDRALYLLDPSGLPVKPDSADGWIRDAARRLGAASGDAQGREGARAETVDAERELPHGRNLSLHAELFTLNNGTRLVAAVVADQVELEDRYAFLIAAFSGAMVVALILVAAGGWLLVREATAPIERTIVYMRRFMADAAHELRTPITVLRSRAEVALQAERDTGAYVAALGAIGAESERMGKIVDDLLTLARADAGERPLERRRVYLDDIVMEASEAASVLARPKQVTVTVDQFEETVVDGDAALLRQLAMILLDNAVKFTPPGGRVGIRVTTSGPGGKPTLQVEDSGIGITTDQLPHVFERFYRGDPARTRALGCKGGGDAGAGLGLAIARWIADAHGAEIEVASTVGVGTRVVVRFAANYGNGERRSEQP